MRSSVDPALLSPARGQGSSRSTEAASGIWTSSAIPQVSRPVTESPPAAQLSTRRRKRRWQPTRRSCAPISAAATATTVIASGLRTVRPGRSRATRSAVRAAAAVSARKGIVSQFTPIRRAVPTTRRRTLRRARRRASSPAATHRTRAETRPRSNRSDSRPIATTARPVNTPKCQIHLLGTNASKRSPIATDADGRRSSRSRFFPHAKSARKNEITRKATSSRRGGDAPHCHRSS